MTGERVNLAALGGPEVHSRKSGVAHVVTGSEAEAFGVARRPAGFACVPPSGFPSWSWWTCPAIFPGSAGSGTA